ncbi:response regulator [Pseudomonas sp. LS44]|uniref:response regulator n=1 Tax=Pseudomonas sp. LS44 TaxID=1357074 RepID=UPI00215B14E0|nr:response regulator [Pseudomonas sp. LS44]UVE17913.1 response regulator [Pseudomonas sp. LS44]
MPRPSARQQSKSILVVEDDDVVRLLTVEVLEEFGYAVLAAGDASDALDLLRSEQSIDLLMSDIGLPDMSGRELAEAARELRPQLPILFASGYAEGDLLSDLLNLRGDAAIPTQTITKPFNLELLRERVRELLKAG